MVATSKRRRPIWKDAKPFFNTSSKKAVAKWLVLIAICGMKAKRIDFERITT
ncbi:MAG TPA: hypothetical protein VEF37_00950 [Thermodesulfovibrionales bacterium]|nr:hypothetical protein [Thermodesulfovibrionales bacterium]